MGLCQVSICSGLRVRSRSRKLNFAINTYAKMYSESESEVQGALERSCTYNSIVESIQGLSSIIEMQKIIKHVSKFLGENSHGSQDVG